ncbi:MAG: WXG100 family type VII secretion target [Clostridia bacterium]|nr:WXG100 family type VII secretion target [Clostridia bacterium]
MALIRLTPEQLESLGNQISDTGDTFETLLTSIAQLIGEIDACWDGLANAAYMSNYETTKESLDALPQIVRDLGEAIVQAAQTFRDAEEQLTSGISGQG